MDGGGGTQDEVMRMAYRVLFSFFFFKHWRIIEHYVI